MHERIAITRVRAIRKSHEQSKSIPSQTTVNRDEVSTSWFIAWLPDIVNSHVFVFQRIVNIPKTECPAPVVVGWREASFVFFKLIRL